MLSRTHVCIFVSHVHDASGRHCCRAVVLARTAANQKAFVRIHKKKARQSAKISHPLLLGKDVRPLNHASANSASPIFILFYSTYLV